VAGAIKFSLRKENLSFSHHTAVAGKFDFNRRRLNLSWAHYAEVDDVVAWPIRFWLGERTLANPACVHPGNLAAAALAQPLGLTVTGDRHQ
jgi:hypothetical protein